MRFAFYDPKPFKNDYVSRMYLQSMREYARDKGIHVEEASHLTPTSGRALVCNADYLTPEVIKHFRENDCPIFAFSCIDSAWLSEALRYNPAAPLVSRIFMITGVQTTNYSAATVIDSDFRIRTETRKFVGDTYWEMFDEMRRDGTIQPLPYVQWSRHTPPARLSFEQRRPTVLFRGGHHFQRVLAYFFALQRGFADPASGFLARDYFCEDMNPDFRFCQQCREIFRANGDFFPAWAKTIAKCSSPAPWGGELDLSNTSLWNNRCPESFYWLAQKFSEKHGSISLSEVERALNFRPETEQDHLATTGMARFAADCKWEFSIHASQRFWEAASVGTVMLLPRRANDQGYFPCIMDGEHYITYSEDFSDFTADVDKERYEHISENVFRLWEKWMKPTETYAISPNLLRHIFNQMGCEL